MDGGGLVWNVPSSSCRARTSAPVCSRISLSCSVRPAIGEPSLHRELLEPELEVPLVHHDIEELGHMRAQHEGRHARARRCSAGSRPGRHRPGAASGRCPCCARATMKMSGLSAWALRVMNELAASPSTGGHERRRALDARSPQDRVFGGITDDRRIRSAFDLGARPRRSRRVRGPLRPPRPRSRGRPSPIRR